MFNDDMNSFLLRNDLSIKNLNTNPFRVRLDFLVVEKLPFEMIVGRRAIITHNLWERCVTTRHLTPETRDQSLDALLEYINQPTLAKPRTLQSNPHLPSHKDNTNTKKGQMSKRQTNHDNALQVDTLQVDSPGRKHTQTETSSGSTTRKRKLLHTQLLSQMDLNDGEITNSETVLEPRRSLAPGQDEALPAWLITNRQQLLHLSENCRPMEGPDKSTSSSKWIRAHITDVFNYEDEAWDESLPGTDPPEYEWDNTSTHPPRISGVTTSSFDDQPPTEINYIPTRIRGDKDLVRQIQDICLK
jgi:hypothetical protein